MNRTVTKQGNPILRALILGAGIAVLGAWAFSMTACDIFGGDKPGGTTEAGKVTYTGTHDDAVYTLTITEKTSGKAATYTPKTGDSYKLEISGNVSNGTVSAVETTTSTLKLTLTPTTASTAFTVTVSPGENKITNVNGTVTFDNGTTKNGPGDLNGGSAGSVTKVDLDLTELKLKEDGKTATLTATVSPSSATNKNVTWTSSNPSVATVGTNGTVTAVSAGGTEPTSSASTTITVKTDDGGKTKTCSVTVYSPNTTFLTGTVKITGTPVVGETLTAVTTNLDVSTGITYQWKSGTSNVGTNSDKYTLASTDVGSVITVTVSHNTLTGSITSAPTAAVTGSGTANLGFIYVEEDHWDGTKMVTIIDYNGPNTNVVIPSKLGADDTPVTKIYKRAFSNKNLTSVTIPASVTEIQEEAFSNNPSLANAIFQGIPSIVNNIFDGCPQIKVTIGENVNRIWGFSNLLLKQVDIGAKVNWIDGGAFQNNKLEKVSIPNQVIEIGNNAFSNNLMTSLTFTSTSRVAEIGDSAFKKNNLKGVEIPASVKSIGQDAFSSNDEMTSVTILATGVIIGSDAFNNASLTKVTLNGSLSTSSVKAFPNDFNFDGKGIYEYSGSTWIKK